MPPQRALQTHLSIHTFGGHALVPCSLTDAVDLGRLHAAAAERQLLQPTLCLQGRRVVGHPLDRKTWRCCRRPGPLPPGRVLPSQLAAPHILEPQGLARTPQLWQDSLHPRGLRSVVPCPRRWQLPAWLGERVPSLGSSRDPRGTSMYSLGPEELTPFTPDTETERVTVGAHEAWARAHGPCTL